MVVLHRRLTTHAPAGGAPAASLDVLAVFVERGGADRFAVHREAKLVSGSSWRGRPRRLQHRPRWCSSSINRDDVTAG